MSEEKHNPVEEYDLPDSSFDPELDAEPGEKKPTSPKTQVEAKKPQKHSRRIVQMARDLGLSEEEIEANSPDQLEDLVYYLNKQAMATAKRLERQEAVQEAKPAEVEEEDEKLDMKEEDFDPDLVKALKGIKRESGKRIKELEKQLAEHNKDRDERRVRTNAEQIDAAFEDLAQTSLFGKGPGVEMQAKDIAFQRRKMVLQSLDQNPPKTSMGLKADVKARARELFGVESDEPAETEKPRPRAENGRFLPPESDLDRRKREWQEEAPLARPSQRSGATEPKGVRRAEKSTAAFLRDRGIKPEDFDGTEESGLPE